MKERNNPVDISIISPVYNEEENLSDLYAAIAKVIPQRYQWELILVDDGSTDGSRIRIRQLAQQNNVIKALFLSKNFGHQIALSAGIDHAQGDAVITMDSDLQHPPEMIPKMLALWERGVQVVNAVRDSHNTLSGFKRMTSWLFYSLMRAVSKINLANGVADFRLMDRKVVNALKQYPERDRFLRGIINDMGFRQENIRYKEAARVKSTSKYNLTKMIRLALTGMVSFSTFPLRICTLTGFTISLLSLFYTAWILMDYFVKGSPPTGIASILVGVFFIGGLQLTFMGILGEYLITIFKEVKQRPLYLTTEKINFPDES